MARNKKKKTKGRTEQRSPEAVPGLDPEPGPVTVSAPLNINSPFAELLKDVKVAPKRRVVGATASHKNAEKVRRRQRPTDEEVRSLPRKVASADMAARSRDDKQALHQAFQGVRRLDEPRRGGAKKVRPDPVDHIPASRAGEAEARARLAALVSGGLRFEVERDVGWVRGVRSGGDGKALKDLREGRAEPDDTVDLHGQTEDGAAAELARFLRDAQRKGARLVRVIHGKGLHSPGGQGVLGERVIEVLTHGAAAPLVLAFITSSLTGGGSGALLVRLKER